MDNNKQLHFFQFNSVNEDKVSGRLPWLVSSNYNPGINHPACNKKALLDFNFILGLFSISVSKI